MSIFMVDPEHINVLVWAATRSEPAGGYFHVYTREAPRSGNGVLAPGQMFQPEGMYVRELREGTETAFGQMLVDANAASMNLFYKMTTYGYTYTYQQPRRTDWRPVDILRAISGFEFQACLAEGWRASEAKEFCRRLRSLSMMKLPRYKEAPWGIGPDSLPAHVTIKNRRELKRAQRLAS